MYTPIANRRENASSSPDFAIIDNERKSERRTLEDLMEKHQENLDIVEVISPPIANLTLEKERQKTKFQSLDVE